MWEILLSVILGDNLDILCLDVTPSWCNRWPNLFINFNNQKIFSAEIDLAQQIIIDLDSQNSNCLQIGIDNKSFGTNNQWDTQLENDTIVQDLFLEISSCKINDVEINELLKSNLYTVFRQSGQDHLPEKIYSEVCNFNGYFQFDYTSPVLNSITNQKFKLPIDENKSYFSNYTTLFHYDDDLILLDKIDRILKEIEELNSKRS